ncbi:hypothetical protein Bca52824_053721 [Brassica carinata]|uniref:SIAH-type domain-containing protein n=1 Tax=Brassica carinata TaxID=52824 RepID=A0A8X7UNH0_BRACI|nr:hypothetical protein Bca52824_053721 [Brassica carinata]
MDGVGPHSNLQTLDSFIANIRLRLGRLEDHVLEVPCANAEFGCPANVTCFAMRRHLMQCEYSSTLEGSCVCPFSGCSFIGTYCKLYAHASSGHSDDLQMIESATLSFEQTIIARVNSASSELSSQPFVVPSFMGPTTEVLILINSVETVG